MSEASGERRLFILLACPAIVLTGFGAILPIVWIIRQSFFDKAGELTIANYGRLLTSDLTWSAFGTTLSLSVMTLAICTILGIPLSLALASVSRKTAGRLMILLLLPLWTSILVRTYGWVVLLRRDGLINSFFVATGLSDQPVPLVYNFTGALIGMVHYMLPLFVLPVYAAMRDIDGNIVRAAASLGASFWKCVRTVILPLSTGGVISGATVVFVYTLGFFITPAVLGGGKVNPISIRIERTLSTFQDWGEASALGLLLLILVMLIGAMLVSVRRLLRLGVRNA